MSTSTPSPSRDSGSLTPFTDLTTEILKIVLECANYLGPDHTLVSYVLFTYRLLRTVEEASTDEAVFAKLASDSMARAAEYDQTLIPGTNAYNDMLSELQQCKHILGLIIELERNGEPLRVMGY